MIRAPVTQSTEGEEVVQSTAERQTSDSETANSLFAGMSAECASSAHPSEGVSPTEFAGRKQPGLLRPKFLSQAHPRSKALTLLPGLKSKGSQKGEEDANSFLAPMSPTASPPASLTALPFPGWAFSLDCLALEHSYPSFKIQFAHLHLEALLPEPSLAEDAGYLPSVLP